MISGTDCGQCPFCCDRLTTYSFMISFLSRTIDFLFFSLSLWIYLWLAETSQQPISQTIWLKVNRHCNHCNHCGQCGEMLRDLTHRTQTSSWQHTYQFFFAVPFDLNVRASLETASWEHESPLLCGATLFATPSQCPDCSHIPLAQTYSFVSELVGLLLTGKDQHRPISRTV